MSRTVGTRRGAVDSWTERHAVRPGGFCAAAGLLSAVLASLLLLAVAVSGVASARTPPPLGASIAAETNKPPKVTKQPSNTTVPAGQSATFNSTASGVPVPTVQWEVSTNGGAVWSPIEGATSATFTIAVTQASESGNQLRAVYKNLAGEATSKAATLTVQQAPAVIKQPLSITVEEGQNAAFEAAASGSPAPTVKWETSANGGKTWTAVTGATSGTLTIPGAKATLSGHEYRATFKNSLGEATSEAATLTVQKAPAVTKQPLSVTVNEGQSTVFEATASGFPAPTVQWQLSTDGGGTWSAVEGATTAQLTIAAHPSAKTATSTVPYSRMPPGARPARRPR